MYAINFEYDKLYLSDFGFIVCDFNFSNGEVTATAGSNLTFEKVSRCFGKKFDMIDSKYEECIAVEFDICKNPDIYEYPDRQITTDEYRDLMRWLNRRTFLRFHVLDRSEKYKDVCYYNATFNVEKIKINETLYGLHLKMETDSPFGYAPTVSYTWEVKNNVEKKVIGDFSDEIGYIYPDVILECKFNGDFTIYNSLFNSMTVIQNCTVGEIITIKGKEKIIMSSNPNHKIYNDFNYEFLKFGNLFNNHENKITVSKPCNITISYVPIIKDAP